MQTTVNNREGVRVTARSGIVFRPCHPGQKRVNMALKNYTVNCQLRAAWRPAGPGDFGADASMDAVSLGPAVAAPSLHADANGRVPGALPSACARGRRYYASRIVGSGAHGVVVEYRTASGQTLAIKVVAAGRSSEQEDRACLVPRLRNVVPQWRLDASDPPEWAFYGMPLLDRDLNPRCLPPRIVAARAVAGAAAGLRQLADAGYRYFDVKPCNILLGPTGYMLGDVASVGTRASTYPPPASFGVLFSWYQMRGGLLGRDERAYNLNCAWTLMVTYLLVALPRRELRRAGQTTRASRAFSYESLDVSHPDRGYKILVDCARLMLAELPNNGLGPMIKRIVAGRLPRLDEIFQVVETLEPRHD